MKIKTTIEITNKEFYKAMFELSLHHKMRLPLDEAKEYIEAIGFYNDYDYRLINRMLDRIDEVLPFFNIPKNPKGIRRWEVEVGRESSPVVYVNYHTTNKAHFEQVVSEWDTIQGYAIDAKADEINIETKIHKNLGFYQVEMRFWWD